MFAVVWPMKKIALLLLLLITVLPAAPALRAQALDGSGMKKQTQDMEPPATKLSIDEQLKLRAAQQKAASDPAVVEAVKKRDQAINEFRAALQAAMIKADPTIAPLLEKVEFAPQPHR